MCSSPGSRSSSESQLGTHRYLEKEKKGMEEGEEGGGRGIREGGKRRKEEREKKKEERRETKKTFSPGAPTTLYLLMSTELLLTVPLPVLP